MNGSMRLFAATVIALASACSSPAASPPIDVTIRDFTFEPAAIDLELGSTVRWTNEDDGILHTVTTGDTSGDANVPDGVLDEQLDSAGTAATFTPPDAGTYSYYCSRHNAMTGTITVAKAAR